MSHAGRAGAFAPGVRAFAPVLLGVFACAPPPSEVPLGLGPLALEEQRAAEAAATQHQQQRQRARRLSRPAAAERREAPEKPVASAEPAPDADDVEEPDEGAEPATASPGAFQGLFAGDDVAVFRLTGFPEREQRDDKAQIRIEPATEGRVSITLINSEDGSDLCALLARVEGNTALLESGQPCFGDGSEGSLEAELTSGRAVIDGDRLTMDAEGTLSVVLPDQELDGELSYSFEGERE